MEAQQLVEGVMTYLLPLLLQGGIEGVGGRVGEYALDRAHQLWGSIVKKSKDEPAIEGVVAYLENHPENLAMQQLFQDQLKKLLERDTDFAREIQSLLGGDRGNNTTVTKTYNTGDVSGVISESITGDVHIYQQGGPPKPSYKELLQKGIRFLKALSFEKAAKTLQKAIEADDAESEGHYYLALALLRGRSFNSLYPKERSRIERHLRVAQDPDWLPPSILLAILEIEYYHYHGTSSDNNISVYKVTNQLQSQGLSKQERHLLRRVKIRPETKAKLKLNL